MNNYTAIDHVRAMGIIIRDVLVMLDNPNADEFDATAMQIRCVNALRSAGIAIPCERCAGSGNVTLVNVMVSGLPGDADDQPCPDCDGTGDAK